ncbi:MAG: formate dehydrogenase accessory protein FdhE [Candidatus Dormibacteraeota bacterium]|nr:formate dehydrogenase accessory protein FdhE [Candidatus Dormibacteraeota bacterium]
MIPFATADQRWTDRRRRAAQLRLDHPHAEEMLVLYVALLEPQRLAAVAAERDRPAASELPEYVAGKSLPAILRATLQAGPDRLRAAALSRFHDSDLAQLVSRWIAGEQLPATDHYLARAATAPVLEVLPGLAAGIRRAPGGAAAFHCPSCGGLPQLSYFGISGEALVTAPRFLLCSICSQSWSYPRMICPGCGSDDTSKLPIFADTDHFANVRADGCEVCRQYLLTVDLPKDPSAVPVVDELAALPLDLFVQERAFTKITPNLMGF